MVAEDLRVITAVEIRAQFLASLHEQNASEMNYIRFSAWLRLHGMKPKGQGRKEQERSIYNALTGRADFARVAPGVFAPVETPGAST